MKLQHITKPLLFFVVLIVLFSKNKALGQDTARAQDFLVQGITSFNNNDFETALTSFKNSIHEVPAAFTYFMLAAASFNTASYPDAKMYANKALVFTPPPLKPNRRGDARYIRKAADSMLHLPVVVVQETHTNTSTGVTSQPMTMRPRIDIKSPKGTESPLTVHALTTGAAMLHEPMLTERQNTIVHSTFHADLEKSGQATEGDFWWNVYDANTASIVPQNGARFYLLGTCASCYDNVTLAQLKENEAKGLFTGNSIDKRYVNSGTLIAYITRNHFYGVMKIESFIVGRGVDMSLSFKTFAAQ
ncbi:hypothetical protein QWZ08_07265 [Ferruginibacter paludis]|uniref:hypothetical protein n=1 Tax=Ferruginibacter paludis TaxID=1310417 RepID=UPI0025B3B88A|nr:hypothetical protein [Ferruginibacter paludis]MDN3655417.1 hypothetical protein [Ferruginibacter paludis]